MLPRAHRTRRRAISLTKSAGNRRRDGFAEGSARLAPTSRERWIVGLALNRTRFSSPGDGARSARREPPGRPRLEETNRPRGRSRTVRGRLSDRGPTQQQSRAVFRALCQRSVPPLLPIRTQSDATRADAEAPRERSLPAPTPSLPNDYYRVCAPARPAWWASHQGHQINALTHPTWLVCELAIGAPDLRVCSPEIDLNGRLHI